MQDVGRKNTRQNNPLATKVNWLTQESDQLKAELARSLDNAAWLKGQVAPPRMRHRWELITAGERQGSPVLRACAQHR